MKTNRCSIFAALILSLVPSLSHGVGVLAGPFTNTANAHLYYLLTQSTWTDAEAKARTLGGHLVTINDAAENQWVFDTFASLGGVRRLLWIGLTDVRSMGNFQWISGQPRTYENWSPVEPNNLGFENYALMYPSGIPADAFARYPGVWNNLRDWTSDIGLPLHGVIEIEPSYWVGVVGFWADTNLWTPVYPNPNSVVVLHDGFLVKVDSIVAQVGALTLAPGSTVQVLSGGRLELYGPAVNNGSLVVAGNLTSYADGDAFVQNGTMNIGAGGQVCVGCGVGGGGVGFDQTGGYTIVNGTLAMGGGGGTGGVGLNGGTLSGNGMIAGNLAANGGVLSPGASPGSLTISNDFTQNAGNTLSLEVAGRGAGQFDQLKVGGTAQLGGTLAVAMLNGFAPAPGDSFPILTCSSRVGTFSAAQMPAGLALNYTSTNVMLVVTGTVPAQIVGPTVASGVFVFSFGTVSNQSYTIESSDDVAGTNWVFQANITGTGTLLQFATPITIAPQRYFRVRQP